MSKFNYRGTTRYRFAPIQDLRSQSPRVHLGRNIGERVRDYICSHNVHELFEVHQYLILRAHRDAHSSVSWGLPRPLQGPTCGAIGGYLPKDQTIVRTTAGTICRREIDHARRDQMCRDVADADANERACRSTHSQTRADHFRFSRVRQS